MKKLFLVAMLGILTLPINQLFGCSSFTLKNKDNILVGYNNDDSYEVHYCIMTNNRNITKVAFGDETNPAKWTSKYGSITFNSSKEFPYSGMNEKGLIITDMALNYSGVYPFPNKEDLPAIEEAQSWIQYQLDNSASVEEVISSTKEINVVPRIIIPDRLDHYLVCDKSGSTAIIEFLEGEMVVHTGDELPVSLVTNWKYDSEIKKLIEFIDFDKKSKVDLNKEQMYKDTWQSGFMSDTRSIRGTYLLKKYQNNPEKPLVDCAFDILESMHTYFKKNNFDRNQFSTVFDPKNMVIYYYTRKNRDIRKLEFSDFNFRKPSLGLMYDIDKSISNVGEDFIPYSNSLNTKQARSNFNQRAVGMNISKNSEIYKHKKSILDLMIKYPKTLQFFSKESQN
jgi:penicillin V acylase-like amidase (Ntn superfamily)